MMTQSGFEMPSLRQGARVYFVGAQLREKLLGDSEAEGWLPVRIPLPGTCGRGRLGLILEEAIEKTLEARGACAPGIGACADSDASLSDQLYRARLLGAPGLALAIEKLEAIANQAGALDAEDSAVLRWWVMTARERPLRLYFDARDEMLGVYTAPTRLGNLVRHADEEELRPSAPPPIDSQMVTSIQSMQSLSCVGSQEPAAVLNTEEAEPSAQILLPAELAIPDAAQGSDSDDATQEEAMTDVVSCESDTPDCSAIVGESAAEPATPQTPPTVVAEEGPKQQVASQPLHPEAAQHWRDWMRTLDQARGPKPLGIVEQLYVNAYVPLADAAARGIAGPEATEVLGVWSSSFARSYREAFDALRLRGKRPLMVLDIADVALRLGRLHGARTVQLVLVDGLRFDLGLRVEERMRKALGQQAAMTERLLLWSALPSNTATQLELIGRGPEGLKGFETPTDSSAFVSHGRAAATLRRVRTGSRDVMKLDLVESRLSEPGVASPERLDSLADEVTQALSSALLKFAPRTLALVFGDHGFVVDPEDILTAPARHGGSSPEEVLVPAFAWLVGATH
jgi:hypothetical protein